MPPSSTAPHSRRTAPRTSVHHPTTLIESVAAKAWVALLAQVESVEDVVAMGKVVEELTKAAMASGAPATSPNPNGDAAPMDMD